jgi:hypothetical protein
MRSTSVGFRVLRSRSVYLVRADVAGLAQLPSSVVALAAVPGSRARRFWTRPSLSGACAPILWPDPIPQVHHGVAAFRWRSGRWEFHGPDGTPIPAVGAALTGNTDSLIEMHIRARLRIDRTTLTPDWDGERLDPEPILDALLPRRINTAA